MVKEAVVSTRRMKPSLPPFMKQSLPRHVCPVAAELKRGIMAWEKQRGIGKPAEMFIARRRMGRTKGYVVRIMEGSVTSPRKVMITEWKCNTLEAADKVHAVVMNTLMALAGFQGVIATSADAGDGTLQAGDIDWGDE
jgi:hypothetical protein